MDNRRVKFRLKILSRFGKIIRKPWGVKFFGAPCTLLLLTHTTQVTLERRTVSDGSGL